jgi:mRNA-degrading endonuclease RelE of RelBE toxin-antitoxin system
MLAEDQILVRRAIRALPLGNVVRLKSNAKLFRLRVDPHPWRVIFQMDSKQKAIQVLVVDHRDTVYDRLPNKR